MNLNKCFSSIINDRVLKVTVEDLKLILKDDLEGLSGSAKDIENVLVNMLPYYMKIWPGWSKAEEYSSGKLSYNVWYEKFRQYLMYKICYIIKSKENYLSETTKKAVTANKSLQTETDMYPPFSLHISGPPNILTNMVFLTSNNDVVVKQHNTKPMEQIHLKAFLNWPYLSIEVNLPEISLVRVNQHEYQRYLAVPGTLMPSCSSIPFIRHITQESDDNMVFTYSYLRAYTTNLLLLLNRYKKVLPNKLIELNMIFNEFLSDVKDVNINSCTISTQANVCYNIGCSKYVRNKKMMNNKCKSVTFFEIIIPSTEFQLKYIKDAQDLEANIVQFKKLQDRNTALDNGIQDEPFVNIVNESVIYRCTICDKTFSGVDSNSNAVAHFALEHKTENSVLCMKCRNEFTIIDLCSNRWSHLCSKANMV